MFITNKYIFIISTLRHTIFNLSTSKMTKLIGRCTHQPITRVQRHHRPVLAWHLSAHVAPLQVIQRGEHRIRHIAEPRHFALQDGARCKQRPAFPDFNDDILRGVAHGDTEMHVVVFTMGVAAARVGVSSVAGVLELMGQEVPLVADPAWP